MADNHLSIDLDAEGWNTRISDSDLEALAASAIKQELCTGLAAAVWIDGKAAWKCWIGFTSRPEDSAGAPQAASLAAEPIAPATLFDAASLTKPLATALLVMKAREAGELDLDFPLGTFLEGLPPATAVLPLQALMTHSAGLPAIPALHLSFPDPGRLDRTQAIAGLLTREPETPAGAHVVYSCTGYMLLGLVLERIGGKLLGELFREEIALPAGIEHAGFAPAIEPEGSPAMLAHVAATEYCPWRGRRLKGQVHDESAYCMGGHAGNAGLFLSLESALALGSLYLQDGWCGGTQILQPATVDLMLKPLTTGMEERRSLAFKFHDRDTADGPLWPESAFGHTGFTGTSIFFEPTRRIMAVLLTNRVYYGRDVTADRIVAFRKRFHSAVWRAFC
mgnify:CR=1 FL=1